jgi:hypothetical protein
MKGCPLFAQTQLLDHSGASFHALRAFIGFSCSQSRHNIFRFSRNSFPAVPEDRHQRVETCLAPPINEGAIAAPLRKSLLGAAQPLQGTGRA